VSTFAELAARNSGVGVAYLLEGSTDLFVTTPYLYSTHDGRFGGSTAYDPRIVGMGDLQRGFGVDGVLASSTVSVELANTDGGADFLITTATVLFKVRWRLKIALYDVASPSDLATKVLGVFVNLDNPRREAGKVLLSLADDAFGQAAELAIPPTWGEADAGAVDTATTEPPVPVAMGGGTIPAIVTPYLATDTTVKLALCATTDTGAADQDEVTLLTLSGGPLNFGDRGDSWDLAREMRVTNATPPGSTLYPLWSVARTGSITKDGRTWKVIYVTLYTQNLLDYLSAMGFLAQTTITSTLGTAYVNVGLEYFMSEVLPTLTITATGPRWSSRTYAGSLSGIATIRGPDIAYDLLRYYSRGLTSGQVDQASFTAAASAAPLYGFKARWYFSQFTTNTLAIAGGSGIGRTRDAVATTTKGELLKALSALCQGGLFDIVTDWDGVFTAHVLANSFDLQTTTPTPVDETLMRNVTDCVPSAGERWAPYNRLIMRSNGRVYDNLSAISSWGVVLSRTLDDSAVEVDPLLAGADFGIGAFGGIGIFESVVRPIISFDTTLEALNWELGDFISVTWSRGASGLAAYSATVFRIESMTLHPKSCAISVRAVWIDDLADTLPYLLDDETLLVRTKPLAASMVIWNDAGGLYASSSGGAVNFTTMGVQPGDILVLRDSTQAADEFSRNRAIRVTVFDDDYTLILENSDTSGFPALPSTATIINADWSIVRGATTYHTAVSDPTNYPSGGRMYGKLSESGTFSDSTTANVLQAG